MQFIILA